MNDARKHALQFLAPVTASASVPGLARSLINLARRDTELATLFMTIQDELGNGRDLLDARQSEILDRLETPSEIDLPTAPAWLRPAIVAAYLRAKDHLTPRVAAEILTDPLNW
jgi:hypothetical protein